MEATAHSIGDPLASVALCEANPSDDDVAAEYEEKKRRKEYEVLMVAPIQRGRKVELAVELREAVARQKWTNTETILNPFGHKTFGSIQAFTDAWKAYCAQNYLRYRTRHSLTANAHNKIQEKLRVKANKPRNTEFEFKLVPVRMGYAIKTLRCTHGCVQKPRGDGTRVQASTRYTGCDARITVIARRQRNGGWAIETVSEVIRHNHHCNETVYDSYQTSALIEELHLFSEVKAMLQANAPSRNISDVFGMVTGKALSAQQLANFRRDRLGGKSALENMRLLLERFASFAGSDCMIVEDQDEQICGVVLQSAAQREWFGKWGDSMILDWTHNTNNAGYYLGALMVTTVTGHGVSVCDFLCVEQSKPMMLAVLQHFVKRNPGAALKPYSIVIDKDYTEWAVLREVFPKARVVLCQFHVLKWFAHVVTQSKYDLSIAMRERVLTVLTAMVYAKSKDDFRTQERLLFGLLCEASPSFIEYVSNRWYSCREMWSDCERGAVFTATNTTSNRLESSWGQVKKILGLKLRMDLCLEAVWAYQTHVGRREFSIINTYATRTILRSRSDPFIRPVLQQVSDYCAKAITDQWRACVNMDNEYVTYPVPDGPQPPLQPERYTVETMRAGRTAHEVNVCRWTCTCASHATSALPCRHLLFVARRVLNCDHYPVFAIPSRWLLNDAVAGLPTLRKRVNEIQSLRTGLLQAEATLAKHVASQGDTIGGDIDKLPRTFAHVKLQRRVVASGVVTNSLEKRAVIRSGFEQITSYLMAQSTPRFKVLTARLQEILAAELALWRNEATRGGRAVDGVVVDSGEHPAEGTSDHTCDAPDEDGGEDIDAVIASFCDEEDTLFDAQNALGADEELQDCVDLSSMICGTSTVQRSDQRTGSDTKAFASTRAAVVDAAVVGASCVESIKVDIGTDVVSADVDLRAVPYGGSDTGDDVSSLSLSDASALIQAAALRGASLGGALSTFDPDNMYGLREEAVLPPAPAVSPERHGILSSMKLHIRNGTTRQQRTNGDVSVRLAALCQVSGSPVKLDDFIEALQVQRGLPAVAKAWHSYPRLFTDKWLLRRRASLLQWMLSVSSPRTGNSTSPSRSNCMLCSRTLSTSVRSQSAARTASTLKLAAPKSTLYGSCKRSADSRKRTWLHCETFTRSALCVTRTTPTSRGC